MTRHPGPPPGSIVLPYDTSGGWWNGFCGVVLCGMLLYALLRGLLTRDPALMMGAAGSGVGVLIFGALTLRRWLLWIALDGDRLVWRYALQNQEWASVAEVATLDRSFGKGEATITFRDGTELHSGNTIGFPGLADAIVRVNPDAQILYTSKAW